MNEQDEKEVPQKASEVSSLLIGDTIPNITLNGLDGKSENLASLSTQNTLFIFYRGGWCPFCSKELAEIAEIEDELSERGINIVGISPDKPEYLQESIEEIEFDYRVLSDSQMKASKAFGIAYQVDPETVENYRQNGMDLVERSGEDHKMLPVPAVFLANSQGVIEFQYVNPDYKTRIDKNVLLSAVDAMLES